MIRTVVFDCLDELEPFAAEWNRLCLDAPQQTPFLSHAWTLAYLAHRLRRGESWFCVLALESDRLVGVLPLVVTPIRRGGYRQFVLRAPADSHTLTGDALVSPGRSDVLAALMGAVAQRHPGHLYLDFSKVPAASESVSACEEGIGGNMTTARPMGRGAYLPIRGTFDAYRAGLSGNFRSNLNKAASKLKKLPDVSEQFLVGAEATEATLPRFMEVEARSWKGPNGSAILGSDELVAFYTTLCRRLSAAGWLEWHLLNTGERTIAANLAIRMNATVHVWKLGYDEEFAQCSPGGMLLERLIQRAYASGEITEISLLTNEDWYERWQMQWRPYYGIRLYPLQPSSWAVWAFDSCRKWAAGQKRLRQALTSLLPTSA